MKVSDKINELVSEYNQTLQSLVYKHDFSYERALNILVGELEIKKFIIEEAITILESEYR